jgi:hypothetical protein
MSLTYGEIQEHLSELDRQRAELKEKAREMHFGAVREMANNVVKYIEENGFEVKEILHRIQSDRSTPVTTYYNPDNPEETYSKGPLAGWIKEKMVEAGLDPADRKQVVEFKKALPIVAPQK